MEELFSSKAPIFDHVLQTANIVSNFTNQPFRDMLYGQLTLYNTQQTIFSDKALLITHIVSHFKYCHITISLHK